MTLQVAVVLRRRRTNDSGPGTMPGPCKMGCDWLSIGARQDISYSVECGDNRWLPAMLAAMMAG